MKHDPRIDSRLVFNCTPELPYSPHNLVLYIQALGHMQPGTLNQMTIRHDAKPGRRCRNCGVRLR